MIYTSYLHYYFNIFVCPPILCHVVMTSLHPVPRFVSQNITNESFLVRIKSEIKAFMVTLKPFVSMKRGDTELPTFHQQARQSQAMNLYLASVFHHLPSVGSCMHQHTRKVNTSQFKLTFNRDSLCKDSPLSVSKISSIKCFLPKFSSFFSWKVMIVIRLLCTICSKNLWAKLRAVLS